MCPQSVRVAVRVVRNEKKYFLYYYALRDCQSKHSNGFGSKICEFLALSFWSIGGENVG